MDKSGSVLIEPKYKDAKIFANGCIYVSDGGKSKILRRQKTVTERDFQ